MRRPVWDLLTPHLGFLEAVARKRFRRLFPERSARDGVLRRCEGEWDDLWHEVLIRLAESTAKRPGFRDDQHVRRWAVRQVRYGLIDTLRRLSDHRSATRKLRINATRLGAWMDGQGRRSEHLHDDMSSESLWPAHEVDVGAAMDAEVFWGRVRAALQPSQYRAVRAWAVWGARSDRPLQSRRDFTTFRLSLPRDIHRRAGFRSRESFFQIRAQAMRRLRETFTSPEALTS